MNVYFDKENFISFLESKSRDEKLFYICEDMIKNHVTPIINISFEDFIAIPENADWVRELTAGGINLPQLDQNHLIFNEKSTLSVSDFIQSLRVISSTYSRGSAFSDIYLLDRDIIPSLEYEGNLEIGEVKEELNILSSQPFDKGNQYNKSLPLRKFFTIIPNSKYQQHPWGILGKYSRPCSDIIIIDPYILKDSKLWRNNIVSMISMLAQKVNGELNIVIITLQYPDISTYRNAQTPQNQWVQPNWDEARREIKNGLNITANVSFICPEYYKRVEEHDRFIFTNYALYNSGPSFNYYNAKGKFTSTGRNFKVQSLAFEENYDEATELINDMQIMINKIINGEMNGVIFRDSGSNLSNYLTF